MNNREIAEIRKQYKLDKSGISHVRGCCVNGNHEIISEFDQSLGLMSEDETEEILALLRKTLSGTSGANLTDVRFSTQQVQESEEHKLLSTLRSSALKDDEAVHKFYEKVAATLSFDSNFLIFLAYDSYDMYSRSKDGEKGESTETFSYILCSICPLKPAKSALGYIYHEGKLGNIFSDSVLSAPELGFMFPAFDDRMANIYSALYYTKSKSDNHEAFAEAVFHTPLPMPVAAQSETFKEVLTESFAEDCSYETVQAVYGQLRDMVDDHKASKSPEPLTVTKQTVSAVLKNCGISEEKVTAFEEKYDEGFGVGTELNPSNVIGTSKFEVKTPDVVIRVNPERTDLVETRVIDGIKYVLVRADSGVEVNGIAVNIREETQA
ncbi:MAG: DUF4317 domain-containing protein [Clostridia bacterium]|nr:DUF4317 domain-containing protein [Clostridia bacterium]